MESKQVVIMRSWPGGGKSTWIKNNLPGAFVCSADDYFTKILGGGKRYAFNPRKLGAAHNWCFDCFKRAIDEELPTIVLDNTNLIRSHYSHYVKYAQAHGYDVFQKVLSGSFKNTHGVSPEAVEKMRKKFEVDTDLPNWA